MMSRPTDAKTPAAAVTGAIDAARRERLTGEHNAEVYGALGLGGDELEALRGDGVI